MDLPQLRTVLCVADLGSLSKAADRLRIAQPALSRQVRLLEAELGCRLFDRHGRGMVLTDAGREVLRHAARIMAEVDEMRSRVADLDTTLTGRIAIGMPPTVADIISVPLVAKIKQVHPRLEVRLVSAYSGYLVDWLQRGEIDLAVLYDPQAARSLRSRPLLIEDLFLIGPAPGNRNRPVRFKQLADETLLLPSYRHGLRAIVERCAAQAGIALRIGIEADSYATLKDLVRGGYGKTILPLAPIAKDVARRHLGATRLIDPSPTRRLVLSMSSDRVASRATRFAAEAIEAVVGELVENKTWSGRRVDKRV